jgi:hypothetical protein
MRNTTIKTIQYELDVLNKQIDAKIITGRSYKRDALRHRMLLNQLRHMKSREGYGFWSFFGRMAFN